MKETTIAIPNPEGMHARPAGVFVKKAQEFKSTIEIGREGGALKNGKSILSLMSLGLQHGDPLKIVVSGEDEAQAIEALSALVANRFTLVS